MPVQRDSTTHQPAGAPVPAIPDGALRSRPFPADRSTRPARTRAGAAWVGVCVGALVLIALVVFMLQNTAPVDVAFLGMTGTAPLALVLLIAGLGVGAVALVVGSLRIGQLRRSVRAGRRPGPSGPVL